MPGDRNRARSPLCLVGWEKALYRGHSGSLRLAALHNHVTPLSGRCLSCLGDKGIEAQIAVK
jgi:hypothetical protein